MDVIKVTHECTTFIASNVVLNFGSSQVLIVSKAGYEALRKVIMSIHDSYSAEKTLVQRFSA